MSADPDPYAPRAQRKARTRERLLRVAEELFAEQGVAETRASDIANAAGVAHGTVFAHFGSKLGLLQQLMEQFTEDRAEKLGELQRQARSRALPAEQEFWIVLEAIWSNDLERLGLIRAYASYSWQWGAQMEAQHKRLRSINRECLVDILKRARLDIPPGWPDVQDRVGLFYAEYREALRTYTPARESLLWTHIQRTARHFFPMRS